MSDTQNVLNTVVHTLRNQLNQASMHAEVAKMLVEQDGTKDKIQQSLDIIIGACEQCDITLTQLKSSSSQNG